MRAVREAGAGMRCNRPNPPWWPPKGTVRLPDRFDVSLSSRDNTCSPFIIIYKRVAVVTR